MDCIKGYSARWAKRSRRGSPARPRNTTEKPSSPSPPRQPRPLPSSTHPPPESEDHDRFSSSSICHANFQSIALQKIQQSLAKLARIFYLCSIAVSKESAELPGSVNAIPPAAPPD